MITTTCDPTAVHLALQQTTPAIAARIDAVDHASADRIAADARSRVARRTGATAASIIVVKSRTADGYLVIARGAGRFLEFGTKYMAARAFFLPAAALEQPGHDRRIREAVQDGLDAVGLGA